jgi:hypothetical protein
VSFLGGVMKAALELIALVLGVSFFSSCATVGGHSKNHEKKNQKEISHQEYFEQFNLINPDRMR